MKRKIAAIMAADVAGYSRLVAEDEEETLRRLASYRSVFSDGITAAGGRIFNTAGDAILAEFQSAVDAVRCAVDVQETLKSRNLAYPPSRQMNFRIGITIGDVVERDGDLLGDGVNIAARLESLAPPGGVSVSRSVYEAVSNKVSVGFTDLGPRQLKNIPERVQVYTIREGGPAGKGRAGLGLLGNTRWVAVGLAALLAAGTGVVIAMRPGPPEPAKVEAPAAAPQTVEPANSPLPAPVASEKKTTAVEPTAPAPAAQDDKPLVIEPAQDKDPQPPAAESPAAAPAGSTAPLDDRTARIVLPRALKDCLEVEVKDAAGPCRTVLVQNYVSGTELAAVELRLGRSEREAKRTAEAIEAYGRSIAASPTSEAYNHRGIAYFDRQDWQNAEADFTKAVELDPRNGEAWNNRAWLRYRNERPQEGLQDADKAVRLLPKAAYVWDTRGHIQEALGNSEAAIKDFRAALAIDPETKSSLEGLERLGQTP